MKHPCTFLTQTPVKLFRVFQPTYPIHYFRMKCIIKILMALIFLPGMVFSQAESAESGVSSLQKVSQIKPDEAIQFISEDIYVDHPLMEFAKTQ